jgi:tetratricopeptide (TPR) repeat protein
MVARRFSTTGLPREGVIARLAAELAPLGLGALELDATAALVVADGTTVLRPTERWTILRRVLGALASERPVIVWIDDAHWGRDSTEFACWLLDGAPFPCVLVVTTHAEIAHTEAQRAVEALMAHPATTTIVVPPLDPAATVALCEQLLALAPDLRARVAELSEGNPLVVEQIVGAWVARGNLVVDAGSGGWDLPAGDAPSTLREAWGVRLAAALEAIAPLDGDGSGVRALVDAAAVLGDRVRDAEWEALATALSEGSAGAATLLVAVREALVAARLAVPEEGGWSFAHGLLREAVLAQVEAPTRIHAAAARVLEARGAALRRVASHHAAAGATDLALQVELREAVRLCDAFELVEASVVLDAMAGQVGTTAADNATLRMRVEITILRARLAELRGACEDAAARMAEGVNAVADLGDGPLLARVALAHGVALRSCGRFAPAAAELGRALEAARAAGMQRTEGQALLALGRLELVRGGLDAADGYLAAAREVGEAAGDPVTAAEAIGRRGDIGRQRGNQEEAAAYFEASLARYRALGHMAGTATQLHGLAEAHRLTGRLEEAEAGYHQSIDLDTAMGKDASIPRFNLSLCLLARGRYGEVVDVLTELDAQWERAGRRDMAAYARSGILCAASQLGDTVLADAMLALLPAAFAEGVVDIDLGQLTRDAARAWEAGGDAVRARACAGFALAQWVALGDEAEAAGMRGVGDKE